jgi:hypothetical protein
MIKMESHRIRQRRTLFDWRNAGRLVRLIHENAVFPADGGDVRLGPEHDRAEWVTPDEAAGRLSWPRSVTALRDAVQVLQSGDAGAVEDVLRVV